jgi:transposase-like protein
LNAAEPGEQPSIDSGSSVEAAAQPARQGRRRGKLSPEQEREVARLYAEASVPTSAIRERFGIGESALYRILQQQGIALRGRTRTGSPRAAASVPAAASGGRRRGARAATGAGATTGARAGRASARAAGTQTTRGGRGSTRRGARSATAARTPAASSSADGAQARFRIRFEGERLVQARSVSEALRQLDALGATEIISVTREP